MYSLGLILYELYHPFNTESERYHCLQDVRRGCLDDQLQHQYPLQVLHQLMHTDCDITNSHNKPRTTPHYCILLLGKVNGVNH